MKGALLPLWSLSLVLPVSARAIQADVAQPVDGWVMVQEDVWLILANDVDDRFGEARESFLKKNHRDAARELHAAAAILRIEAKRAEDNIRADLSASAEDVERLARRAESGHQDSEEDMNKVFARADVALARHFHAKTGEYLQDERPELAGRALDATTDAIDNALRWSGRTAKSTWQRAKNLGRDVAAKLVEGSGWVSDEVSQALEATSRELKELSNDIRTVRDEP